MVVQHLGIITRPAECRHRRVSRETGSSSNGLRRMKTDSPQLKLDCCDLSEEPLARNWSDHPLFHVKHDQGMCVHFESSRPSCWHSWRHSLSLAYQGVSSPQNGFTSAALAVRALDRNGWNEYVHLDRVRKPPGGVPLRFHLLQFFREVIRPHKGVNP